MLPPFFLVLLIAFVGSATRDEVEVGADALQLDFTATGKQHIWNKGFAAAGVIDSVGEVDTTPASQSSLMDSSGEKGSRPASGSSGASLTLVSQPSSDPYDSNGEDDSRPSAGKEIKGSGSNVYKYIQELGAGAFGLVWMARQTRGDSGDTVAIKTSTDKAKAETEYFALKQCEGSRFVVRMFDHFKDNGGRYYIVMEFAEAGDLAKALHDNTPIDKLSIAKDIVSALADLKERNVAHMDLKPGNVLLWNSGDQWTAKLTDFGLAVLNIDQEKTKSVGTGAYASPEVFRPPFWGPEVDVWTFGVLLYEMVTGEQPYTYYERQPDRNRQERQNFPREKHTAALESVPLEIQEIIIRTQTFDSGARITIEQIRSSSLFQQALRGENLHWDLGLSLLECALRVSRTIHMI